MANLVGSLTSSAGIGSRFDADADLPTLFKGLDLLITRGQQHSGAKRGFVLHPTEARHGNRVQCLHYA